MKLGKAVYDTFIDPKIVPFGKHKGEKLADIDTNYLTWIMNQDWIEEKHPEFFQETGYVLIGRDPEVEQGYMNYIDPNEFNPFDPDRE